MKGTSRLGIAIVGIILLVVLFPRFIGDWGLRTAASEWAQICEHNRAFLTAYEQNDQAAMQAAVAQLRADVTFVKNTPGGEEWFTQVADAAAAGNPNLVRQNIDANCQTAGERSSTNR
jgi:Tfp pilus assembly protein PilX